MNIGPAEILVVLVLALLVFGPKKLPEVSRQIGQAMRELRKVQTSVKSEINKAIAEPTSSTSSTPTLPPKRTGPSGRGEPGDHESSPAPSTPPVEPGDSFL